MVTIYKEAEKELKKGLGKALNNKEKTIPFRGMVLPIDTVKAILGCFKLGYPDFRIYED